MKKIISIVVVVLVIVAGIYIGPKVVHKCDSCGKVFFGAGYEPNVISDVLSDTEQIICKECAQEQRGWASAFGKSLDEYKRSIF